MWNPRFFIDSQRKSHKDFVRGYQQMLDALGFAGELGTASAEVIEALFAYRNKCLHFGYEWPPEEARKFAETIQKKQDQWRTWSKERKTWFPWFQVGTINDDPWLSSVTDSFVERVLREMETMAKALRGMERRMGQCGDSK
ncbi:MAG: hypothetical protein V2A79_07740 [Planctomycetota bacterium]